MFFLGEFFYSPMLSFSSFYFSSKEDEGRSEGDPRTTKGMVFLRDDVSLQKLKQQHKSADEDADDEHAALEFEVSLGKNEGLDVQFVKKKNNTNNNNDEMEWWVTKCICHVENTSESIELQMEESATIAMLKMKLRAEINKNAKKTIYTSSTVFSSAKRNEFTGATTSTTNTSSSSSTTVRTALNGRVDGKNTSSSVHGEQRNVNESKRIVLGGGVPASTGKNTMRTNMDSNNGDDFRGFDDNEDDDDEHEYLERNMSGNNHQQQQEKDTNKKNENVFLRDLSEFANELVEVVAPKPKEQPINHDTKVEKSNDSRNDKKEKILETTGSWEKIDEWQAWGEIGQVQVKHRTPATRAAAIQPPNVTVNVKKVERGKMEPVKKLNATKVPGPKKKNLYSLPSLSFVSNIQDSFTNVAAASTKYSTMVAQLVPGFAEHSLSAHIMIFVTVAAILVKLMGFTFWLLCVVLVCYARVRSEENLRALAEKKALDLQSKLTKVQDDLEQLQFAAATVAANTASRGGSLSSGSASVVNGQPVADVLWMNSTIAACWDGFLRNWLSSLAGNLLSDKLSTAKPSVLDSIHLASFEMKHKPPSCRNVRVLRSRKVFEGVMLELGVELSDISFNMTIHSKLAQLKIPLKLAVELDATNLLLRTSLLLIDRPPYAGSLKTSFADLPETKLKIIPEGVSGRMGNIAEFPGIDLWIKNSIQDALVKNLLEPNSYTWNIEDFFQQYYK